jgi:hypothetical protein
MAIVFVIGERDGAMSFAGVATREGRGEKRVGVGGIFWSAGAKPGEMEVRHLVWVVSYRVGKLSQDALGGLNKRSCCMDASSDSNFYLYTPLTSDSGKQTVVLPSNYIDTSDARVSTALKPIWPHATSQHPTPAPPRPAAPQSWLVPRCDWRARFRVHERLTAGTTDHPTPILLRLKSWSLPLSV